MKRPTGYGLSVVGIGTAACVGCCAGPVLALSGGLGAAGVAAAVATVGAAVAAASRRWGS